LLDSAVARRQLVIAIALLARVHGWRVGVGQGALCVAHSRGTPRAPRDRGLGELIPGRLALEGAIGHQGGGARGGWSLMDVGLDHLAQLLWITAMATARLHQPGNARLVLDDQLHQDWVEVGTMISTIALGEVHDLLRWWLVTVIAPIDMNARAVEVPIGGTQVQTLGGSRRDETVECCHPMVIEGIQGAPERLIVELCGSDARRNEAGGRLLLKDAGPQVERLIDQPQALEHQRVDRLPDREVPPLRVLLGGLVNDVAKAEFVEHASHKAAVLYDLATVRALVGPNHLR
jgi:hypothetical protein